MLRPNRGDRISRKNTERSEFILRRDKKQDQNTPVEGAANKPITKKRLSRLFSLSIFINLLSKFTDVLYDALINSFIGHIFTAYSSEQLAFERGAVRNYFKGGLISTSHSRKIKQGVERVFETSFFINKLKRACKHLLKYPLKVYGMFFISFGMYSAFIYALKTFLIVASPTSSNDLLVSGIFIIIALPLMSSSESLGHAVRGGRLTSAIFMDAFGFKDESFEIDTNRSSRKYNFSFFWGMLAGLLTFFIPAIYLPIGIALLLFFSMIFVSPEIGVIISIFVIPFCSLFPNPSIAITILASISILSYIIKLLKGKRIFKVELVDLAVLAFLIIILMGGMITVGGRDSFLAAAMSSILIFGFFCVVNLMRTDKWLSRCTLALVSSSVVVAIIGVFEYAFGFAASGWVDTSKFGYIEGRATSLFDNPNVLAMYLVLCFPMLLAKASDATTKKGRLLGGVSVLCSVLCVIFTWSRGAWLALIASTLLFLIIRSRKTLSALIVFLLTLPAISFIIPLGIRIRFASIGDITDSSTYYRIYTWRGTINAIKENLFSGYGYGTSTFAEIYPQYAYAGMESAEHSHSLLLQIIFGVGIFGLLIFAIFLFLFAQKNFEHIRDGGDNHIKKMSTAAFCSVFAALVMGLFDNVWYNYRIMFLFWIVAGISCAYVRLGDREKKRDYVERDQMADSATIDI